MTTLTVTFTSKDPLLAQYYEFQFRDMFTREAEIWAKDPEAGPPESWTDLQGMWKRRMLLEAEMQEHYFYDVDKDGRRVPYCIDGKPMLMIPEVEVSY